MNYCFVTARVQGEKWKGFIKRKSWGAYQCKDGLDLNSDEPQGFQP